MGLFLLLHHFLQSFEFFFGDRAEIASRLGSDSSITVFDGNVVAHDASDLADSRVEAWAVDHHVANLNVLAHSSSLLCR